MRSHPGAEMMMAGTRSTPYSPALSLSRTRFNTSRATAGLSRAICSSARLVGPHVSQPIVCSKKTRRTTYSPPTTGHQPLFEQVIEGLARAARGSRLRLRMCFALDCHARREEVATVPRILGRNPDRDGLCALEAPRGIERFTLRARPKIGPAACAPRVRRNRTGEHVATPRAAHHFVEAGYARGAAFERFAFGFVGTRLDAIGRRLGCLRSTRCALSGAPLAR